MSKNKIKFIIILLCICLAGILAFQYFWLGNAIKIKKEQFNKSVTEALTTIVEKLETSDAVSFIGAKLCGKNKCVDTILFKNKSINNSNKCLKESLCKKNPKINITINNDFDSFNNKSDIIKLQRSLGGDSVRIMITSMVDSFSSALNNLSALLKEEKLMKGEKLVNVLNKMIVEYSTKDESIEQKVNSRILDSIIKAELFNRAIDADYEYAIVSGIHNKILSIHSTGFTNEMLNSSFRINLFPNDLVNKKYSLLLSIPDKNNFILKSLWIIILGTFIFSILIIATFTGTIMIIIKQKKISDIKTDFINNMTHEFKTPIATISLAVDAINNPKVIDDKQQITNYTRIIKEENSRMNTQVEHVLQMALLDKKDFNLDTGLVNMNDIILKAVDKIRLIISEREGSININFGASESIINGDESHLLNVLINLLDNANKYSPPKPEINIITKNINNIIEIQITDNGIGMSKEHRTKIFDKFYRITTGNIQNVKGFGLGLSYSKAIIMAHNGNISVKSESGKGSTFIIILPLKKS